MKKTLIIITMALFILCGCANQINTPGDSVVSQDSRSIVGKWVDVKTEKIFEYTDDGFYYEYLNESFTTDKTRYEVQDGKITYYLDGSTPDEGFSVDYEIKNGNLIINGVIEYKPIEQDIFGIETEK